jgi:hypothetical protein
VWTHSLKKISERQRSVRLQQESSQVGRRDEARPQAFQVCLGDPTGLRTPPSNIDVDFPLDAAGQEVGERRDPHATKVAMLVLD